MAKAASAIGVFESALESPGCDASHADCFDMKVCDPADGRALNAGRPDLKLQFSGVRIALGINRAIVRCVARQRRSARLVERGSRRLRDTHRQALNALRNYVPLARRLRNQVLHRGVIGREVRFIGAAEIQPRKHLVHGDASLFQVLNFGF